MSKAKTQIVFEQVGIASILRHQWLEVPINQREYSWEDKHITTLFQDFSSAIAEEKSEYFLGTIVTIPRQSYLEVVDGQQRLATVAILLWSIREYFLKNDPDPVIARSIDSFLVDINRERRESIPKLKLNVDDNEFFRKMITMGTSDDRPSPDIPSHELIDRAFTLAGKHVRKVLSEYDEKDHWKRLNTWIDFVEHKAQVILLKVPSDANAYKMFETLNDRGLKSTQADLVKNYLFGQSEDRINEAQHKWARMQRSLESLDEDDITVTFLRQSLIAMRGHLKEGDVYEEVQKRVRGPQTSIEFITNLERLASTYVAIFNPEDERWNQYSESMPRGIETLNLLNIKTIRPLMLAAATKLERKEMERAFTFFISLGVRLMIASNTSRGSVEVPLANAAMDAMSGEITNIGALKAKLRNIIPADEQFKKAFEVATVSKRSLARYYLRSLEMKAKTEPEPWFIPNTDKTIINLEHILPEHPEGNYPEFDDETSRIYFKRIGNMALMRATQNSDFKNKDFQTKSSVYKQSPYILTKQISQESTWNPKAISSRQKFLAKLAIETWPI